MSLPGAATLRRSLVALVATTAVPTRHRWSLLRRLGLTGVGQSTIAAGVHFANLEGVSTGRGCFLNVGVFLDHGPISLGRNVFVGPRAMVLTGDHPIGSPERRAADGEHRAVTIGDGCWIGAGAIVLPGVQIGAGCVIGAGAVVARDCAPHGVYAGVPARRLRDLPDTAEGT